MTLDSEQTPVEEIRVVEESHEAHESQDVPAPPSQVAASVTATPDPLQGIHLEVDVWSHSSQLGSCVNKTIGTR